MSSSVSFINDTHYHNYLRHSQTFPSTKNKINGIECFNGMTIYSHKTKERFHRQPLK